MFRRALLLLTVLVCTAACGGSTPVASPVDAATSTGQANLDLLATTDDIGTSQLIDTATGELTTLGDVVVGDRAVLVWYWAPD